MPQRKPGKPCFSCQGDGKSENWETVNRRGLTYDYPKGVDMNTKAQKH
jgi:hypothetical protein